MLDFAELPSDGIKFEQLIRALLVKSGLEDPRIAAGPGAVGTLVATESAPGKLAPFKRKWLVNCKHYAGTDKVVSVEDIIGVCDACAAVGAGGLLLASSIRSTSVVNRCLKEMQAEKGIRTQYWDRFELERRLKTPNTFALMSIFFPKASATVPWKIRDTSYPSFWAAEYKEYFFYLGSKSPSLFPALKDAEEIIRIMENVPLPAGSSRDRHVMRPRAIYFDEYHDQYRIFADYILPRSHVREMLPLGTIERVLRNGESLHLEDRLASPTVHWNIRYISPIQESEHFDYDLEDYYEPYIDNFRTGRARPEMVHEQNWVDLLPYRAHVFD